MMLNSLQKNTAKRPSHSGGILYKKNQAIWLAEGIFVSKLDYQTAKFVEMTEPIYCFSTCLLICKKTA